MEINVQELADNLLGTCEPLGADRMDALTQADCEQLDSLIRECECCGWWVAADEINDDSECQGCADNDDFD